MVRPNAAEHALASVKLMYLHRPDRDTSQAPFHRLGARLTNDSRARRHQNVYARVHQICVSHL